jgi:23S rRNA (uracil1939-C5)-methyltransferase
MTPQGGGSGRPGGPGRGGRDRDGGGGRAAGGGRGPGGGRGGSRRETGRSAGPGRQAGPRGRGHPAGRAVRSERRPAAPTLRPPAPVPGTRLAGIDEAEVVVEKLVLGGEGLARVEGVPLFIPRAAPGDRLRVRLTDRRPDFGRAAIVEILEPGPGRRPDPYPELNEAGICDLQHLEDALQPRLKAEAVREALVRLGRVEMPAQVEVIAGQPWEYRLRTQLHVAAAAATGVLRVGYHARGTHDLVAVARCALLVPELDELLPELPERLAGSRHARVDLAAGDGGAVTAAPLVLGLPHGEVWSTVGGLAYSYDARCFFQVHRQLLPRLVERAVGEWEGEEAFDLYAGVGLFSLALAHRYARVVSVESDRIAGRYARNNARRNRLPAVHCVGQVVESWISQLPQRPQRVLVDPPRAGLNARVRQVLAACRAERLTYVSCDAATLARDLRLLDPVYRVESVCLLDLFPQTGHMETVVQLTAK